MADTPRALERELRVRSRPVSAKKKNRAAFYLIDDFGKVDPAPWVSRLMVVLVCLTLVSTATAAITFWYLFHGRTSRADLVLQLDAQEQTIQGLVGDKEILMARLVLTGNTTDLDVGAVREPTSSGKKSVQSQGRMASEKSEGLPFFDGSRGITPEKKPLDLSGATSTPGLTKTKENAGFTSLGIVAIEGIRVGTDNDNGDLLVRFNIKNISPDSDTVAGYVFVVLKPGGATVSDWLVLPAVAVDKGRPALYTKGRYFSIAHFKPINFRVKSTRSPDAFNLATVFVYDGQGGLIFMEDIMLAETEG